MVVTIVAGLAAAGLHLAAASPAVLVTLPGRASVELASTDTAPEVATPETPPPGPPVSQAPLDAVQNSGGSAVPTDAGTGEGTGPGGSGSGDGSGTGPIEPAPTTTTTTIPPPPPPPPLAFGTNGFPSSLGPGHTADDTVRALADIAPGASIVRFTLSWQSLQLGTRASGEPCGIDDVAGVCSRPGRISWSKLDADLAPLAAAGLQVVLAPLAAPPWARGGLDLPTPNSKGQHLVPPADTPEGLGNWRAFVAALVDHVRTTFPGLLRGLEVWNEPNGREFWTTFGGPDPHRYTRLLCAAYEGVKAVDPTVPVILGGTHPDPIDAIGLSFSIPTFLDMAYAAGAAHCMDSIGIHPYPKAGVPDHVDGFAAVVDQVRQAARRNGDAGRTISITEVNMAANDETSMADFLTATYQLATTMPDIDMFVVHTLFDYPRSDAGICRSPHAPKAAASALKQLLTGTNDPATC